MRAGSGVLPALLVVAGLGCGGEVQSERTAAPPPVVVEMARVEQQELGEGLDLTGQLEADETVMLRAETAGVIDTVAFVEGQEVQRGDLLFRLRDAEQRALLREAEAQLVLAEQAWRRASALAGSRVVSPADLDQARANRDAARARVDLAKVNLERTEIQAPFGGTLGPRLVSPGDRITTDTPLVQLDATARLKVTFTVPEHAVPQVHVGQPVEVRVAPFPDRSFAGEVFFVAPSLDPRNRRLTVKAVADNADRALRPGLFASVRLETSRREGALVVPESAVVYDTDGPFVWRVGADALPERVGVVLGIRRDGRVEVTRGLAAGDRIVASGTNKVVPGRPLTTPPAAS
ncbi:MAG TPA: efflux RND transporter periplasmic adaptor subunit [Candidatus Limnocylindria bacterium]|nr:efflux RND transporter periplasmic adaptor subunit [Candidatus Limnocylindria bacterium]